MSFDKQAILNARTTESGAKGQGALIPEDVYPDTVIESIDIEEPRPDDAENGVTARLVMTLKSPGYPSPIRRGFNIKDWANPHKMSNQYAVMKAIWPYEADRVGIGPSDLEGEVVKLRVSHVEGLNGLRVDIKYASNS